MKKKDKPIVSIIMNCHNGSTYLDKSLKSVLKQSFKKWELIFLNNKSKDKSKEIIIGYKDKRIRYFETKTLLNLYQARNQAIKKSRAKYLAFLDADDWWHKEKLTKQKPCEKSGKGIH